MNKGSALLSSESNTDVKAEPRLKLLLELEPAHRVFFRNLLDTLLFRPAPRIATTSRPATFWKDVFISSPAPWGSFFESLLWHVLVFVAVWSLNQGPKLQTFPQRSSFRTSYVTYYKPSEYFPAVGSSPPRVRSKHGARSQAASQPVSVSHEAAHSVVAPPDIKAAGSGQPNLMASSSPAPAMPLSATARSQFALPAAPTSIVAPPPDVYQAAGRQLGPPQASAVAPPPGVGALPGRRAMSAPGTGVILPPPTLQGSIRKFGDTNVGRSEVVSPPPGLPMHEGRGGPGMADSTVGGAAASVVPPPPSFTHSATLADRRGGSLTGTRTGIVPPPPSMGNAAGITGGRGISSLSGTGSGIVPPPPSVQGTGNSAGARRVGSLSGTGSGIVPPAPSVQGMGGAVSARRVGSLSGAGSGIVPPPPSAQAAGGFGQPGRLGSMTAGSQVVPPPPSVPGVGGTGGSGRAGALVSGGGSIVPPPPSVQGVGNSMGTGHMASLAAAGSPAAMGPAPALSASNSAAGAALPPMDPMDIPPTNAPQPPPTVEKAPRPTEDLPLRLIGMALALPGQSYFSNYEVYLAERRLRKGEFQLIKLVYEFLPYQKRLSEYVQNSNGKVYKLRVTRDEGCDESLLQMTWPDQNPGSSPSAATPPEPTTSDRNALLPCYRTTADDYRRALSHPR
ncbi:MAG TPA: hypothetical protein VEV41_05760 [Terriglobales bacterium]|nr:hypothetical protein [Terriglobales bacterium]